MTQNPDIRPFGWYVSISLFLSPVPAAPLLSSSAPLLIRSSFMKERQTDRRARTTTTKHALLSCQDDSNITFGGHSQMTSAKTFGLLTPLHCQYQICSTLLPLVRIWLPPPSSPLTSFVNGSLSFALLGQLPLESWDLSVPEI